MAETKRLKVFLSHAHGDADAVRALSKYLRREGVDVWLDKEKLLPGVDWNAEIRKAVRESDVIVVCLSNEFNKAGYRQREVRIALDTEQEKPEGEIYIIPARLEVCDVPESLSKWQWVDLFEEGGRRKLVQALRIRADQIGASLRRRGHYGKPTEPHLNSDEAEEAPTAEAQPSAADQPTLPDGFEEWMKSLEAEEYVRALFGNRGFPEGKGTPSGFWVDENWNVYRNSKKLGTLTHEIEYKLLTELLKHKGQERSTLILVSSLFMPEPFFLSLRPEAEKIRQLDFAVENIRRLIEEDFQRPKFLVKTAHGYKLDW